MAARAESGQPELVSLRHLRGRDLEELLSEETAFWRNHLRWDFSASATLVSRYLDMHALSGFALWADRRIQGYCYYVVDDLRGLIGDLFVSETLATPGAESQLLSAALRELFGLGFIRRVESQLMIVRHEPDPERLSQSLGINRARSFRRLFMLARNPRLPDRESGHPGVELVPWTDARQDQTARLLAAAYEQHVDSRINDQYRSVAGARRFVSNIVLYPGCGQFFERGSFAALDDRDGSLIGVSLASIVGPGSGHVTQLCVSPFHQGRGIGRQLLVATVEALVTHGCREISLTVTEENRSAVRLYQQLGFGILREFDANVWTR